MAETEIVEFLTHLATQRNVAASTQNQALSALLFLYQQFLGKKLGRLDGALRASRPPRLPVVLTREEVRAVLAHVRRRIASWRSCFMAAACDFWNVCGCE